MEKDQVSGLCRLLVAGGSAGSLEVILDLLSGLGSVPYPIVIVMHRRVSAESSLSQVLASRTVMPVEEAEDKELLQGRRVYLAPADYHLLFESDGSVSLDASEKVHFSRPSIDVSFESAALAYGAGLVALLLSGGNADGAAGLEAVRKAGGRCLVENPDTAAVPFMPSSAIARLQPDAILSRGEMSSYVRQLR